jgi:hypothetical protein
MAAACPSERVELNELERFHTHCPSADVADRDPKNPTRGLPASETGLNGWRQRGDGAVTVCRG